MISSPEPSAQVSLKEDQKYFDTSDYPNNSKYSEENKKVIGKMKDEAAGTPTKGFVGLRRKIYSYYLDHKCIKNVTALLKGLSKNNVI